MKKPIQENNSFSKMMSCKLRLSLVAVLVLVCTAVALPVPDDPAVEDFDDDDTTLAVKPVPKSPRIPTVDETDFGVDGQDDGDDYDEEPDFMTWEDLGRMIYSWAKLFADPKQLKPLRKCLTGNAPRDAAQLIKRVETCVRIVDPEFSLRIFAGLLLGSDAY